MPGPIFMGNNSKPDTWEIEVLDDGRLKVTTGPTSPAIHTTAEKLLADINRLMGGEVTKQRRPGAHHDHGHDHGHGNHIHA
jgi:hypothetical protein